MCEDFLRQVCSQDVELGGRLAALGDRGGHAIGVPDRSRYTKERDRFFAPSPGAAYSRQAFETFGQAAFVAEVLPDGNALVVQIDGAVLMAGLVGEGGEVPERRRTRSAPVADTLQLR